MISVFRFGSTIQRHSLLILERIVLDLMVPRILLSRRRYLAILESIHYERVFVIFCFCSVCSIWVFANLYTKVPSDKLGAHFWGPSRSLLWKEKVYVLWNVNSRKVIPYPGRKLQPYIDLGFYFFNSKVRDRLSHCCCFVERINNHLAVGGLFSADPWKVADRS